MYEMIEPSVFVCLINSNPSQKKIMENRKMEKKIPTNFKASKFKPIYTYESICIVCYIEEVFFTCCEIYTGNHQLLQYPRVICISLLRLDQILEISFAETFVWKLKGKIINLRFVIFKFLFLF